MNYNERLQKFIDEYKELIRKDIYINKKLIDNIFDKNKIVFNLADVEEKVDDDLYKKSVKLVNEGYKLVDIHNDTFIRNKLVEYKDYFDNMFKDVDPNIILDDEQRKAILIDEDYSLVIAGAGSGKTTTMAAKVKYLVDICKVDPKKIILLAFTNKAALELSIRINEEFNLNVEVLTFHKLGMKFLRKIFNRPLKITSDYRLRELIVKYMTEIVFPNERKKIELMQYFEKYVFFDENIFKYDNFEDYFKYYADKLYEENINNLKDYNNKRIFQRCDNLITINGEHVKSKAEAMIANYLYKKGYYYTYEALYPKKVDENRSYSPDFTVHDNGYDFYIEYYGLTCYKKDGTYTMDDINAYNRLVEKKRQLHKKYKTDLIELYSDYDDDRTYKKELSRELKLRNSNTIEKTDKEIFYRIQYTSKESQYFKFIDLVSQFINQFKGKGYTEEDFESLIENEQDEIIKGQLRFIKPIYRYYDTNIHHNDEVDFNDMINYAYNSMSKLKEENRYLTYDYLIIDEYQDISKQRYNFAKKLSDIFNTKIVAVGDDWQAIFGFSGSEVELFVKFYDLMGYAEISKITKTYRNSQELIDVAGEFVSRNEEQFQKELTSNKHLYRPIKIEYYDMNGDITKNDVILKTIREIVKDKPNGNILLLGRFNDDVDELLESPYFKKGPNDSITCSYCSDVKIDFLTVHNSKGLGYDNVILINAVNGIYGFPSKIKDDPLIKVLEPVYQEKIEYSEERRLFYVAMTRTKNKLYIIAPNNPMNKRSEFVSEIRNNSNVEEVKN